MKLIVIDILYNVNYVINFIIKMNINSMNWIFIKIKSVKIVQKW